MEDGGPNGWSIGCPSLAMGWSVDEKSRNFLEIMIRELLIWRPLVPESQKNHWKDTTWLFFFFEWFVDLQVGERLEKDAVSFYLTCRESFVAEYVCDYKLWLHTYLYISFFLGGVYILRQLHIIIIFIIQNVSYIIRVGAISHLVSKTSLNSFRSFPCSWLIALPPQNKDSFRMLDPCGVSPRKKAKLFKKKTKPTKT